VLISKSEQETIICWDEENDNIRIYTASSRVSSRIIKSGVTPNKQDNYGWWFVCPKNSLRFKPNNRQIYIAGK